MALVLITQNRNKQLFFSLAAKLSLENFHGFYRMGIIKLNKKIRMQLQLRECTLQLFLFMNSMLNISIWATIRVRFCTTFQFFLFIFRA